MQAPELSNIIEISSLVSEIKHAEAWTNKGSEIFVHGVCKERITIFYS
jgi:hypothetical protein